MEKIKNNSENLKLMGVISSCFITGFLGGVLCYLKKDSKRQGISLVTMSKENYNKKKDDLYTNGKTQYISLKKVRDDVRKDAVTNAKDEVASAK